MNKKSHHPGSHSANPETPALTDPVCGMQVTRDSEHSHTYEGTEYRFCSASCRDKFARDPDRYLAAPTGA